MSHIPNSCVWVSILSISLKFDQIFVIFTLYSLRGRGEIILMTLLPLYLGRNVLEIPQNIWINVTKVTFEISTNAHLALLLRSPNPVSIYLLKADRRCYGVFIVNFGRRSGVFIVNFKHISYLVLVFLLLTLNMQMPIGNWRLITFIKYYRAYGALHSTLILDLE